MSIAQREYIKYLLKSDLGSLELLRRELVQGRTMGHAIAIATFLNGITQMNARPFGSAYSGRICIVSHAMPRGVTTGTIWFDMNELSPYVLVPNPFHTEANRSQWLALNPVYSWQFVGYLNLSKCMKDYKSQADGPILVEEHDRWPDSQQHEFVSSLSVNEAIAYAKWFNKHLFDPVDLEFARRFLSFEEFSELTSRDYSWWCGSLPDVGQGFATHFRFRSTPNGGEILQDVVTEDFRSPNTTFACRAKAC